MKNEKLYGACLAHYAQREPKHFLQLDCAYMPEGGDSIMRPDEDGDCMTAGGTVELMYGATVRVLIPHDTDPVIAVRQLKKLAKWLKSAPRLMKEMVTDRMELERKREEEDQLPF